MLQSRSATGSEFASDYNKLNVLQTTKKLHHGFWKIAFTTQPGFGWFKVSSCLEQILDLDILRENTSVLFG